MVRPTRNADGWFSIVGEPTADRIRALQGIRELDRLSITKCRLITVEAAKRLRSLHSVSWLWLWCDVTRGAVNHVLQIPDLTTLDILAMRPPGALDCFRMAMQLHTLRANHYLTEIDLLAVAKSTTLRVLGVQNADLTKKAFDALLGLPALEALDIEGTSFDDAMAEQLRGSKIHSLDIGATRITRRGLAHLVQMPQLRSLDLWATGLSVDDLHLLAAFPNLEYLSVGGVEDGPTLDASKLVTLLLSLSGLKQLWLDGVQVTTEQELALKERIATVRITP